MGIIKNGRKERDGIRMEMQGKGGNSGRKYQESNNGVFSREEQKGNVLLVE